MIGVVRSVADLPAVPWRNGAGVMRPVAQGEGWTISIATLAGGGSRFSDFSGWSRSFVPLATDRITLLGADGPLLPDADGVVRFDGADSVEARVMGESALALNVMTRPGRRASLLQHLIDGPLLADHRLQVRVLTSGAVTDARACRTSAPAVLLADEDLTAHRARLIDVRIDADDSDRTSA